MPTLKLRHVLALAFLVRLLLIPFFSDDFNYWAALTFIGPLLGGKNPWIVVYNDPTLRWVNPWRVPPLQLYLAIPSSIVNGLTGNFLLMLYAIKLPLVIIDILSIFFVYKILEMWSDDEKKNIRYLLFFAFNPISIVSSAIAGLTDPLPALFMILSLFYFIRSTNSMIEKEASAMFLGLAVAAKLFPAVLIPVFLLKLKKARERIVFMILSVLPFVLFSFPFLIWDYSSYVNVLLFHNVGGLYPFVTFLNANLEVFLRVLAVLIGILMFGIAYIRRTDILLNIVMAFLALYVLMGVGYFDTRYFSWFIPFAVLLASRKDVKIPKLDFLPFIFIPSMVIFLIYNGPYNAVEGITGIYYFAYPWLRQNVIAFQVLPFSNVIYVSAGIISAALLGYYFSMTAIKAPSHSFPIVQFEKLDIIQNMRRHKKLLLTLFLVSLLSIVLFFNVLHYESVVTGVDIGNSNLHFYDDFSNSMLNPQWGVSGNGNYTINYEAKPSYIRLNGNITLYRGWGPIWQGFKESVEVRVRLVYKLDEVPSSLSEASILVTNGGWFGVKKEDETYDFVYFDQETNETTPYEPVDSQWHELQLYYYNDDRVISFDNGLSVVMSKDTFNFACLGLPIDSATEMKGVSFSVDYIEVTTENFYSSASGELYVFLALFVPPAIIICLLILVFSKRNSHVEGSSQVLLNEDHRRI
jgi:hypothetical protein